MYLLRELESGRVVVPQLEMAETFLARGIGLLGRNGLTEGSALWLEPCTGVHTFGMRFAIDLLFLDRQGKALHCASNVRPWRLAGPRFRTRVVVEFPAHALAALDIRPGRHYRAEETQNFDIR